MADFYLDFSGAQNNNYRVVKPSSFQNINNVNGTFAYGDPFTSTSITAANEGTFIASIDEDFPNGPSRGELVLTTPGTTNFTIPAYSENPSVTGQGVIDTISIVCVGGGGSGGPSDKDNELGAGGGGGGLAYTNNIQVQPGDVLSITVGAGGVGAVNNQVGVAGGTSSVVLNGTTICSASGGGGGGRADRNGAGGAGGTLLVGDGGGTGGNGGNAIDGTSNFGGGGGGAGGYSGNGGNGVANNSGASGGNGSGGGAGGAGRNAGGGGVGIFGEGASGAGGSGSNVGGSGGSGGFDGGGGTGGVGGLYGGGGAGASDQNSNGRDDGANGAVRIIWGREFRSTIPRVFPSASLAGLLPAHDYTLAPILQDPTDPANVSPLTNTKTINGVSVLGPTSASGVRINAKVGGLNGGSAVATGTNQGIDIGDWIDLNGSEDFINYFDSGNSNALSVIQIDFENLDQLVSPTFLDRSTDHRHILRLAFEPRDIDGNPQAGTGGNINQVVFNIFLRYSGSTSNNQQIGTAVTFTVSRTSLRNITVFDIPFTIPQSSIPVLGDKRGNNLNVFVQQTGGNESTIASFRSFPALHAAELYLNVLNIDPYNPQFRGYIS